MTFGLLIQLGTNMWERPGAVADNGRIQALEANVAALRAESAALGADVGMPLAEPRGSREGQTLVIRSM